MMKMKKCVFIAGLVLALTAAFVLVGCKTELVDDPLEEDGNKNGNGNENGNGNDNGDGTEIPDTEGGLLIDGFEITKDFSWIEVGDHYWTGGDGEAQFSVTDKHNGTQSIVVFYANSADITAEGGQPQYWCGFGRSPITPNLDLSDYSKITFWVKASNTTDQFEFRLKDSAKKEVKTPLFTVKEANEWEQITWDIPTTGFIKSAISEYSFGIIYPVVAGGGEVYIDTVKAKE